MRSATTGASLCRQCTIPLQEDVEVNEYFALQFHGENLWGNTQFNKSIMVEEKIGELLLAGKYYKWARFTSSYKKIHT
jgi:hypothetical protein